MNGCVRAVDASSGKLLWVSTNLGASIVGELCGEANAIYVGAENMFFYKLDAATGGVLARMRLNGQSFRLLHPVLHQGRLFVQTVQPICVDNLFALSSGGSLLYLRQRFRGTKVIDLQRSTSHLIQAAVRTRDGGTWLADVVYRDRGGLPRCSQPSLNGREAVVIAGGKLLFAEDYCVTCVEHREP